MTQTVIGEKDYRRERSKGTSVFSSDGLLADTIAVLSGGVLPNGSRFISQLPVVSVEEIVEVAKRVKSPTTLLATSSLVGRQEVKHDRMTTLARVMMRTDMASMDESTIMKAVASVVNDVKPNKTQLTSEGCSLPEVVAAVNKWVGNGNFSEEEVRDTAVWIVSEFGNLPKTRLDDICSRLSSRLSRYELEKFVSQNPLQHVNIYVLNQQVLDSQTENQLVRNVFGDKFDLTKEVKDITKQFSCGKSALSHMLDSITVESTKSIGHCRAVAEALDKFELECNKVDTKLADIANYCAKQLVIDGTATETFHSNGNIRWGCAPTEIFGHFNRLYGTMRWAAALWEGRTKLYQDFHNSLQSFVNKFPDSNLNIQFDNQIGEIKGKLEEAKTWTGTLQQALAKVDSMNDLAEMPFPFVSLSATTLLLTDDIKQKHVGDFLHKFDRMEWNGVVSDLSSKRPANTNVVKPMAVFDSIAKSFIPSQGSNYSSNTVRVSSPSSCSVPVPLSLTLALPNSIESDFDLQDDVAKLLELSKLDSQFDKFEQFIVLDGFIKALGSYIKHFKTYAGVKNTYYETIYKKDHLRCLSELIALKKAQESKRGKFETAENSIKALKEGFEAVVQPQFYVAPVGMLTNLQISSSFKVQDWKHHFTTDDTLQDIARDQIKIILQLIRKEKNAPAKYKELAALIREFAEKLNRSNLDAYGMLATEPSPNGPQSNCLFKDIAKTSKNCSTHSSACCGNCAEKIHHYGYTEQHAMNLRDLLTKDVAPGQNTDRVSVMALEIDKAVDKMSKSEARNVAHVPLATFEKIVREAQKC